MGISQAAYEGMASISNWVILIPIIFIFLALFMGLFIRRVEIWIKNKELREMKKKEYVRKDGTLDRIQYLRDLYWIIQHYLGELKDDDPIKLLIKRMEKLESKDEENLKFKELEDMVYNFFNDLRFNDGVKVEEKVLEVSSSEDDVESEEETAWEVNDQEMEEIMLNDEDKAKIDEQEARNKSVLFDPN